MQADKFAVNTQEGFGEALGGVLLCSGKNRPTIFEKLLYFLYPGYNNVRL